MKDSVKKNKVIDVLRVLVIFVFLWGGSFIMCKLLLKYLFRDVVNEDTRALMIRALLGISQIIIFFLWAKVVENRNLCNILFKSNNKGEKMGKGFLVGLSGVMLVTLCLSLYGGIELSINKSLIQVIPGIMLAIVAWFFQSASEEIALRGWLVPRIIHIGGILTALISTSIVFGMLHMFTKGVTVLSITNLILSGVFFALYAIWQRDLWGVWGCHMGWNMALGNIYGFNVSGFKPLGPSVFYVDVTGSSLISGGGFGPEASCFTTLVLMAGVLTILYKLYSSKNNQI